MHLLGTLIMSILLIRSPASQAPPSPVDLGGLWMLLGDSQTDGRATGSTQSPVTALRAIWDETETPPTNQHANGEGGRSLLETNQYYTGRAERTDRTFVYFQESGDQNNTGQTTAEEFGDTFDDFITEILSNTPNAVIVVETAFSFGREAEAFRNWTDYNTELAARVATWQGLGEAVYLSEVDRNIKALQILLTPTEVWFQAAEENAYHYKGTGNLMVALTLLDSLHYPMGDLDLSGILEPTAPQIAACLQVIADHQ